MTKRLLRNLPFTVALIAAGVFSEATAQKLTPPNPGFELGTGTSANYWSFTNSVERTQQYNTTVSSQPVIVNPAEGQYFLKLTTTANPNPQGDALIAKASIKIPYIGHPDSMVVKTAYFPKIQEDGYRLEFDFLKYDSTSHTSNSVLGTSFGGANSTNWIATSGDFTYIFGKPQYDTLEIRILSANPGQHNPQTMQGLWGIGTVLLVDDIAFYGDEMVTHVKPVSAGIKLNVYPNPCKTTATIETDADITNAKLIITDVQGRMVKEIDTLGNIEKLDLDDITPGIYTGTLISKHAVQSFKLVVTE